ncbi:MAG: type sorting protein, partial [Bacteroidetes bacterium]|nr:type sorting protein [Bacteroidota bacterium]
VTPSVALTGLTPATIYQIRVQSSDGTNNSIWSHIPTGAGGSGTNGYIVAGTFSTTASCSAPTALNTGSISTTSANFTWTPTGTATAWDIYYGVQPLAAPNGTTVPTATSAVSSYSATGLSPSTAYAVFVRSNCGGGGSSVWTAVNNFTTQALCPATTSLNITNLTSTSANFTWTAGGSETAWDLYYGVQPLSVPNGTTVPSATSGVTNYSATSLTPNTAYAVYVRANCGGANGTSVWSVIKTFTTPCLTTSLPITEGFNATTIPSCWSQQYVVGTSNLQYVATSSNPGTTPFEGADYVMFNSYSISSNNETRLVSLPLASSGISSVDVDFRWYNENNTSYSAGSYTNEGVMVQYSTDGTIWTDVQFFPRHDASLAAGTGQWKLKNLTLPAGAGNQSLFYVGFKFHSSFGDNSSLDKVNIYQTPSCTLTPVAGTITGASSATVFVPSSYTISPSAGNLQWYTSASPTSTLLTGITNGTTSIINYTPTSGGMVYLTVVASNPGCANDTANVYLPVTVIYPGDDACNPIPLTIGTSNTYYSVYGASTQAGEVVPPATGLQTNTGWGNSTISNTRWFTFVAPASGNVSVQSPNFDTQLAVWSATNCSALTSGTNSSAILIGANDDDAAYSAHGGTVYSSYVRALCLTPGTTYYIQLDSYSTPALASDSTKIVITDLGANSFSGPASSYCLPSAASASLIPNIPGGVFTVNSATTTAFTPSVTGAGTFTVNYTAYGCMTSSVVTVNNTPTVTASANNPTVCQGSSTSLTAGGATTYTWSTAGTGSVIAVTPSVLTTYSVTGTDNGCSATQTVDVNVNTLPNVSLSASQTNVCTNGPTVALTGSPAGGVYTGSNVANGVFTPGSSAGSYTPNYAYTNTVTGCSNSATVNIVVSICTGVTKQGSGLTGLEVYPNPTLGDFTIELNNGASKQIEVCDLTGRVVFATATTENKIIVNLSNLSNGVYFVKIQSNKAVEIVKVIKQ